MTASPENSWNGTHPLPNAAINKVFGKMELELRKQDLELNKAEVDRQTRREEKQTMPLHRISVVLSTQVSRNFRVLNSLASSSYKIRHTLSTWNTVVLEVQISRTHTNIYNVWHSSIQLNRVFFIITTHWTFGCFSAKSAPILTTLAVNGNQQIHLVL